MVPFTRRTSASTRSIVAHRIHGGVYWKSFTLLRTTGLGRQRLWPAIVKVGTIPFLLCITPPPPLFEAVGGNSVLCRISSPGRITGAFLEL